MNVWAKNLSFINADSAILTDYAYIVTIQHVSTLGNKIAYYSVTMGEVYNVLIKI